jgi:uncharacterized protein
MESERDAGRPGVPEEPHYTPMRGTAPWVQTWSGQAVCLVDPNPATIRRVDITRALTRLPRFNGHTEEVYTVAQHSVLVARIAATELRGTYGAPPAFTAAALLHDAHEAYMGDIVRPVAALPGFEAPVAQLKARLQRAIHLALGLPEVLPDDWRAAIHRADMIALATEARDLMGKPPQPWGLTAEPMTSCLRVAWHRGTLNRFSMLLQDALEQMEGA